MLGTEITAVYLNRGIKLKSRIVYHLQKTNMQTALNEYVVQNAQRADRQL